MGVEGLETVGAEVPVVDPAPEAPVPDDHPDPDAPSVPDTSPPESDDDDGDSA